MMSACPPNQLCQPADWRRDSGARPKNRSRLSLLLATAEDTCAARSDEADLRARYRHACDRRRVADVLVVASTVGVLHRVHRGTTHPRPAIPLHTVLVVVVACLETGLSMRPPPEVIPTTARHVEG